MGETSDSELKRRWERAKRDPSVSPNLKFALEKQVKDNDKKKLAGLQKEIARKQMMDKQKKLKDDMNKKGIVNADQKPDAKQMIKDQKLKDDADKAAGQTTEKPQQAV